MTPREVTTSIAPLVAGTTGWNDEAVEVYVDDLTDLSDAEALHTACRQILRHWTEARRPPLRVIRDEYQSVLRNRPRPALPAPEETIVAASDGGVDIARAAYIAQCEREGRVPDLSRFGRVVRSTITTATESSSR